MRISSYEFTPHTDTLIAVFLGAVLATLSGIVATQLEAHFKRRERERDGALLFGELLTTMHIVINQAVRSKTVGDPFGPVTIRMLRAVRREIDIYDRHREMLYDLRDATLRRKIHELIIRMAMPIDGILDANEQLSGRSDDPRLDPLRGAREQAFAFMQTQAAEIPPLLAQLGARARQTFQTDWSPPPPPTSGAAPGESLQGA